MSITYKANKEKLIVDILTEFRIEEAEVRNAYDGNVYLHYKNGILEGIRLAEIIIKQQINKVDP